MDASSSAHPSAHSISFHLHHDDTMGAAISAVRNSRNKRRVDVRHDDDDGNRHPKRMREDIPRMDDEPSPSADTTLVNDHDDHDGLAKGKARDDTFSSSVVSALLPHDATHPPTAPLDDRGPRLADEIESELRCGCCTEIAYNPVSLSPCHHFFCGSCMTLHLSHSRAAPNYTCATCPACRTPLKNIAPSRVVQSLVAALLRVYPERARTERERAQADEVYTAGREIPIPPPRAPNPDVLLPQQQNSANDNLARPCPHCAPGNSFDWICPRPIPNPDTDRANAWSLDNGPPPGHNYCGACDELYAIGAPTSSRCDMCTTGFCGISVPQVCRSHWIHQVRLLSDYNSLQGLIENGRVYDAFNGNPIEVEILFDYLREAEITPNMIYLDIIEHIQPTPQGFEPLIASGIFRSSHPPDMRVPEAQYTAARAGSGVESSSSSLTRRSEAELPSALFAADFTDDEDSDGEGEREERRRTGVSAGSASRLVLTTGNGILPPNGNGILPPNGNGILPPNGNGILPPNGNEISPTTVLPRLADLMRSMRDSDVSPSLTLPAVARSSTTTSRVPGASSSSIPPIPPAPLPVPVPMPVPAPSSSTAPTPPNARRRRICRECATEVFMYGLKEWWGREMHTPIGKERLPVWVVSRKVCENGEACTEQLNYDHAKAFCHIATPPSSIDTSAGASRTS